MDISKAAAPDGTVLKLDDVSMGYISGQDVLKEVTLSIKRGGFYFLSGASGAGKSSLLNVFALALRPTKGKVYLFDKDTSLLGRNDLPPLRRRIGTVFQDYRLIDNLTVEENIGLPLKIAGEPKKQIAEKVTSLLAWVGLSNFSKTRPDILSGGQKQRVAIARAVVNSPDILLADEPSGNLDPSLRLKFMYLFETLHKSGTTIVFATHDDELISKFPHPVLRLRDGKLTQQ